VDRLGRLEFYVAFQLDTSFDHHHHHYHHYHHYYDHRNYCFRNTDLAILQRNVATVECFKWEQLWVDRLDRLEFYVAFQLDTSFEHHHHHHHHYDHNNHCFRNTDLAIL